MKFPDIVLAATLGCMVAAGAASSAEALQQQDIFSAGQDQYHTYRIPSLISTSNGTLLAFCEGRKNGGSDAGDIDVLLKRSTDNGRTWNPQKIIWDDGTNTCGNPCPVIERETGTVWLFLTHNLGIDRENAIWARKSKGTRSVWVTRSLDDGKTWSAPTDITSAAKDPAWGWYATGPGIGIQLQHGQHKGRMIIPCDHSFNSATAPGTVEGGSHVIYSDDRGTNWKIGGRIGPGVNECQVVELGDGKGTLLLSMRNYPKGTHRAQSLSHDGGLTWSKPEPHPQLIDPTCQASVIRSGWPGRIVFSNPASGRRRNMTVRISKDDGKSWPAGRVLHSGPSAYSSLALLRDGEIGCLYERGEQNPYEKITFARFPLSWLDGD